MRNSRLPGKHLVTSHFNGTQIAMRFGRNHAVGPIGPNPFHFSSCA